MVFLIAVNGVYVTYLFLGTLVYLRYAQRIGNAFFVIGTAAFWALFMFGVNRYVAQPPWTVPGYGVSYAFAWFAFVALLLVDRHIRLDPVTAFFSRISYSLYLNHGGLGILGADAARAAPGLSVRARGDVRRRGRDQRRVVSLRGAAVAAVGAAPHHAGSDTSM